MADGWNETIQEMEADRKARETATADRHLRSGRQEEGRDGATMCHKPECAALGRPADGPCDCGALENFRHGLDRAARAVEKRARYTRRSRSLSDDEKALCAAEHEAIVKMIRALKADKPTGTSC